LVSKPKVFLNFLIEKKIFRAKIKKESTKRELDKQQNIFENNNGGKQSGSSAEEEIIMGEGKGKKLKKNFRIKKN